MAPLATLLWHVGDLLEDSWPDARYVTDVVRRSARPKRGAIVVGVAPLQTTRDRSPALFVHALGKVGAPQKNATGKDRVRLDPWTRIEPVALERIVAIIPEVHQRRLGHAGTPAPLVPISLTPALGRVVLDALRELSVESRTWLDALGTEAQIVTGRNGYRLREERDAVDLAFRFAGIAQPTEEIPLPFAPEPSVGLAGAIDPYFLGDTEDDLITVDLRRFDKREELPLQSASVARYEDEGVALTVLNVNKKPLESVLGVDLVYWDEVNHVFTLLQYKRLTRVQRSAGNKSDWAYRDRSAIQRQLALMQVPRERRPTSRDWRLSPSPFWFKFVRADAFDPTDARLLRGMYVPAGFLSAALEDGSLADGPRGGFQIHRQNVRYVTREVFSELVKRGLIGTAASGTKRVLELIKTLATRDEVVLALRTRVAGVQPSEQALGTSLDDPPYEWDTFNLDAKRV